MELDRTESLELELEQRAADLSGRFAEVEAEASVSPWGAEWSAEGVWSEGNPSDSGELPPFVRLGVAPGSSMVGAPGNVVVPVRILDGSHLVVRAPERDRQEAIELVQAALLRAIASMPLGRVRYRVFDPKGLGSSVEALSGFIGLDGRVAAGPPISDSRQLSEALDQLTEQANRISAEHLKGHYKSLAQFVGEYPGTEPFEILVLLDFPTGIGHGIPEKLSSLAFEGPARGISVVLHQNAEDELPKGFSLGKRVLTAERRGPSWELDGLWDVSKLGPLAFLPDPAPPLDLISEVAGRELLGPPEVDFDLVIGGERWSKSAAEGVSTAIGRSGLDTEEITLGDEPVHALIAGGSGMGKSNLLRCMIYGLANRYSPQEANFFLLDFKQGVEFAEFAKTDQDPEWLPHAQVVSVNSDRAFGAAVFEYLAAETERRNQEIKNLGIRKFSELREKHPESRLPRIVLIADEFHVLFGEGDQYAQRALDALRVMAKQGRAAGVHVVLASQTISDIGRGTGVATAGQTEGIFQQFALRIALKTTAAESRWILGESNKAAAELKERGVAIVNAQLGQVEENRTTVIARVDEGLAIDLRSEFLEDAQEKGMSSHPPRIFDGSSAADITSALASVETADRVSPASAAKVPLGSQLALNAEDPSLDLVVSASFRPDPNRHMSIVGSGTREACAVLSWATLGLAAALEPGKAKFTFVDMLREDDVPDAPEGLADKLIHGVEGLGQQGERVGIDGLTAFLAGLPKELDGADAGSDRHFVVLLAFDRAPALDRPLGNSEITALDCLREFVQEGPVVGRHVLGWWTTVDSFDEHFKTSRMRSRFGMRGFLKVPRQDLLGLIPRSFNWDPGANRMLWIDNPDQLDPVVFVPYEAPDLDTIEEVLIAAEEPK